MPDLQNYPLTLKTDEYQSDNFRVYISPSDGYLHVNPEDNAGMYDINVFDISGRLLYSRLRNLQDISVSLSVLRTGI